MGTNEAPRLLGQEPPDNTQLFDAMRQGIQALYEERQAEREQSMRMAVAAAVHGVEDTETGLPATAELVESRKRRAQEMALVDMAHVNPGLHELMTNLSVVRALRDDAGDAKLISEFGDYWLRNIESGDVVNEAGRIKAMRVLRPLTEGEQDRLRQIDMITQMAELEDGFLDEGVKLIGQMWKPALRAAGIGVASSAATANPAVGAGASMASFFVDNGLVLFGRQFYEMYTTLRAKLEEEGVDPKTAHERAREIALNTAAPSAIVQSALETLAGGVVAKPFVKAGRNVLPKLFGATIPKPNYRRAAVEFAKGTIASYGSEILEEGAQEYVEGISSNIGYAVAGFPELQTSMADIYDRALSAMGKVAKGMTFIAPLGPALHYASDLKHVSRAKLAKGHFERVREVAARMKVAKDAPDVLAEVVDASAEGTGTENVYIEGPQLVEALKQSGVTREQFSETLPDAAEQLAKTETTGGDVVISMGDFAAHVATNPELYAAVQDKLRLNEDGFSMEQANMFLQEQEKNREVMRKTIAERASKVADWDEQASAAEKEFLDDAKKSPRYDQAQARTAAKFYRAWIETTAAVDQSTPSEVHAAHKTSIELKRQRGAGAGALAQDEVAKLAGWTPERIDYLIRDLSDMRGNTKGYATRMSPAQFLNLTAGAELRAEVSEQAGDLDVDKLREEPQSLFLEVDIGEDGQLRVQGHEGRHRMSALAKAGHASVPVVLLPRSERARSAIAAGQPLGFQRFFGAHELSEELLEGMEDTTLGDVTPINEASREQLGQLLGQGDTLFQFGGLKSQTANMFDFHLAKQALAAGVDKEEVRAKYGWFVGPDFKWRYELSDKNAKLKLLKKDMRQRGTGLFRRPWRLDELLDHPQLFAAYPDLAGLPVVFASMSKDSLGSFNPITMEIELNVNQPKKEILSTLLHEIAHTIQAVERFAGGGAPVSSTFGLGVLPRVEKDIIKDVLHRAMLFNKASPESLMLVRAFHEAHRRYVTLKQSIFLGTIPSENSDVSEALAEAKRLEALIRADPDAFQVGLAIGKALNQSVFTAYQRLAGEVEARNVQARADFTEAQRAELPPEATADTPSNRLLFRFGARDRALSAVSTRRPAGEKSSENPQLELLTTADYGTFANSSALGGFVKKLMSYVTTPGRWLAKKDGKVIDKGATMPQWRRLKGAGAQDPKRQLETFVDFMTTNLVWLYDKMPEEWRNRARLWYDGARKLAKQWSSRYGLTEMQISSVIAVLSPQTEWFTNVSQAERILDILSTQLDTVWDESMTAAARAANARAVDGAIIFTEENLAALEGKTLGELVDINQRKVAVPEGAKPTPKTKDTQENRASQQVKDLRLAAMWVRAWDEANNSRSFAELSPEGASAGNVTRADGVDSTLGWGSFTNISKAISVVLDGSQENVFYQVGNEHKVRNFYNNIFNPSAAEFVTIDTHASAAVLMRMLSGSHPDAKMMMNGSPKEKHHGFNGGYTAAHEAHRRAAQERGVLPREMQSITWEAVRAMFSAAAKRDKSLPGKVDAVWVKYAKGTISQGEALEEIWRLFGSKLTPPAWVKVKPPGATARRSATYAGKSRTLAGRQLAKKTKVKLGKKRRPAVAVEVAPDPRDAALTARWDSMSEDAKFRVTQAVINRIVPMVLQEHGTTGAIYAQRGGWLGSSNPSIAVQLHTPGVAIAVARMLGDVLNQQAMFVASATPGLGLQQSGAMTIKLPDGYTTAEIDALYEKLWAVKVDGKRPFTGHSTAEGFMTFSGLGDRETTDRIAAAAAAALPELDGWTIEVTDVYSTLLERGTHYAAESDSQVVAPAGSPAATRTDRVRREAAGALEAAIAVELGLDVREEAESEAEAIAATEAAGSLRQDEDRGEYLPSSKQINLFEEHDVTTLLHELSHHFMAILMQRAATPGAAQLVQWQADTLLTWFGIRGPTPQDKIAAWNAMTLDQQREHWENFAFNFEKWLYKGEAPSAELETIFQMVARWFRSVYRYIKMLDAAYEAEFGKKLPVMTPEVERVFGTMLATEDTILAAEAERGMSSLFQSKPEGMTDADWAEYQIAGDAATEDAITKLLRDSLRAMKWLGNAKSKLLKAIQQETRALRAQVEGEERDQLQRTPLYRALRWLRTGEQLQADGSFAVPVSTEDLAGALGASAVTESPRHKLNTKIVKDMLLEGNDLRTDMTGMTHPDGMHPDVVAELFGYESGGELIHELANHKPLEEAVQDLADERMLREHSDLLDEDRVMQKIEEVLHNEHRAKLVGIELKFLSKLTTPVRVMVRAAKAHARELIAAMTVSDLRPSRHTSAGLRARRAAEKAMAENEPVLASYHKRRELLEGQLTRESIRAREEIAKARKLFKRVFQADKKLGKTRDVDYLAVARTMLARLGLAPGKGAVDADKFIAELQTYNPALFEKLQPILARTDAWLDSDKTWQDLSVDEFRELYDSVSALDTLARAERQTELGDVKESIDTAAATVAEADLDNPTVQRTAEPGSPNFGERVRDKMRSLKMLASRPEHWFFRKDRAKEGGVFTRYFWRPVRAAVDRFTKDRAIYTTRLAAMVKKLRPNLRLGRIEMHDLDGNVIHVFGRGKGNFGHAELVGALLHSGNRSNLRKLIVGNKWGTYDKQTDILDTAAWDAFVQRMVKEGYITKEVMSFVQSVWDMNEELKPLAQAAHKRLFGFRFKEIEAQEFTRTFADGSSVTYRGGYIPAKLDKSARSAGRILDLKELEQDFRSQFATTGRGFTMERAENFAEPLSLDIDMLPAHIDDVLRFSHLQPVINEVQRLAKHEDVQAALDRTSPNAWNKMILPWLQRVASQSATKAGLSPDIDKFWRGVRSSAGITMMMGNIVNAAQQFTGLLTAGLRVSPRYIFQHLGRVLGNRREIYQEIADYSPFMASRQKNQIYDSVQAINSLVQNKTKFAQTSAWVKQHAYFAQVATQNWIDAVVWSAKFHETLDMLGADKTNATAVKEAVQRADATIRSTQSSFDATDVAGYTALSPFGKIFTQFTDWFNTMANLQADQAVKVANTTGFHAKAGVAFQSYLLAFGVPMIAAEAFAQWARGRVADEDDDDSAMDELLFEAVLMGHLRSAAAEIPGFGSGINAALGWFDDKAWNDRMTSTPAISLLERAGKGTIDAVKVALDPEKTWKGRNTRDVLTAVGFALGLPGGTLGKHAGALTTTGAPDSFDDYRALATGATSKAQRDEEQR